MNILNDNSCSWVQDLIPRTNIKTLESNEDCEWLIKSHLPTFIIISQLASFTTQNIF